MQTESPGKLKVYFLRILLVILVGLSAIVIYNFALSTAGSCFGYYFSTSSRYFDALCLSDTIYLIFTICYCGVIILLALFPISRIDPLLDGYRKRYKDNKGYKVDPIIWIARVLLIGLLLSLLMIFFDSNYNDKVTEIDPGILKVMYPAPPPTPEEIHQRFIRTLINYAIRAVPVLILFVLLIKYDPIFSDLRRRLKSSAKKNTSNVDQNRTTQEPSVERSQLHESNKKIEKIRRSTLFGILIGVIIGILISILCYVFFIKDDTQAYRTYYKDGIKPVSEVTEVPDNSSDKEIGDVCVSEELGIGIKMPEGSKCELNEEGSLIITSQLKRSMNQLEFRLYEGSSRQNCSSNDNTEDVRCNRQTVVSELVGNARVDRIRYEGGYHSFEYNGWLSPNKGFSPSKVIRGELVDGFDSFDDPTEDEIDEMDDLIISIVEGIYLIDDVDDPLLPLDKYIDEEGNLDFPLIDEAVSRTLANPTKYRLQATIPEGVNVYLVEQENWVRNIAYLLGEGYLIQVSLNSVTGDPVTVFDLPRIVGIDGGIGVFQNNTIYSERMMDYRYFYQLEEFFLDECYIRPHQLTPDHPCAGNLRCEQFRVEGPCATFTTFSIDPWELGFTEGVTHPTVYPPGPEVICHVDDPSDRTLCDKIVEGISFSKE